MRAVKAKRLRKVIGGQEISEERKYGFIPKNPKDKNSRAYGEFDISEALKSNHRNHRGYKISPVVCTSEGRRYYQYTKKAYKAGDERAVGLCKR